jgi:putative iron-dependent peroxidase
MLRRLSNHTQLNLKASQIRYRPPFTKPVPQIWARTMSGRVPIEPQRVDAPLTSSATFLVLSITQSPSAIKTVRSALASIDDLAKNVSIRDLGASFACTAGIGSNAWDPITRLPRPAELHPFREFKGAVHTAVSTPGDLLFHIRSERRDLNFEFERQLLDLLSDSVTVVDETVGFRYFDVRDLLGFVDGTANPVGPAAPASILVSEEDSSSIGGSYIVVQKYVHNLKGWRALKAEQQESIIGRTKFDNEELEDAEEGKQASHKTLATIEDENGEEHDILRDNMPFGSPGAGEFGTYFIGYSRRLWVIEKMLERMFIGNPPGLHDRLLDYSTPLTGTTFFAPSASLLASLDDD